MRAQPFIFSILQDSFVAGAALADLVAGAQAADGSSDSFLLAFGAVLTPGPASQRTYIVAAGEQLIVGMVILVMDTAVTLPGIAQIPGIITRTAYRRNGIASQLLQMAGSLAAANGKPILTLKTAVGGHVAPFFKKAGFAINGIEPTFASLRDGRIVDTVTYWKRFANTHPL